MSMGNPSYEEVLNRNGRIIVSLQNEIDKKNLKLIEMEHKHGEEVAWMRNLVSQLSDKINSKKRCLLEMEFKYHESLKKIQKLTDERDMLHEGCQKELQWMKVMNSELYHEMECLKNENEQLIKQLENSKALNNLQQQNFIEEIQKSRRELECPSDDESDANWNTQMTAFRNQLKEKLEHLEGFCSSLSVKERQYNQELQDARKESIASLRDQFGCRSQLGIKIMGELDLKPFQDFCFQKYPSEEWQEKSAELCSSWEEILMNPHWHPFKRIEVHGILQEILDENDEKLKELRSEYGEEAYKAATKALAEMEEYNASGRYKVQEIWNLREERKATLKEIITYIVRQLKTHKRKRK
ncbi:hypothetical protein RIF29_04406 [Crotalaria pallida]|uniref:Factor of DNA methylation 1-5/IDN2 domain-containing protein n=1 Tax=Crotalaria pallida TaxID=3830 RepID=A0AAN9J1X7_CROPI